MRGSVGSHMTHTTLTQTGYSVANRRDLKRNLNRSGCYGQPVTHGTLPGPEKTHKRRSGQTKLGKRGELQETHYSYLGETLRDGLTKGTAAPQKRFPFLVSTKYVAMKKYCRWSDDILFLTRSFLTNQRSGSRHYSISDFNLLSRVGKVQTNILHAEKNNCRGIFNRR